ncbi:hypothetical protein BJV77DRAFT_773332 [Russula vinacea]|nr:hypothetical protein BJV77DRAFT_773332 [Russula vinacea]
MMNWRIGSILPHRHYHHPLPSRHNSPSSVHATHHIVSYHRNTRLRVARQGLRTCRRCPWLPRNRQSDFPPTYRPYITYEHVQIPRRMADVKTQTWGYKFTRKIARRMPYFRGEPPARATR